MLAGPVKKIILFKTVKTCVSRTEHPELGIQLQKREPVNV
jgi:hypothetical protein